MSRKRTDNSSKPQTVARSAAGSSRKEKTAATLTTGPDGSEKEPEAPTRKAFKFEPNLRGDQRHKKASNSEASRTKAGGQSMVMKEARGERDTQKNESAQLPDKDSARKKVALAWLPEAARNTLYVAILSAGVWAVALLVGRLYLVTAPLIVAAVLTTIAVPAVDRAEKIGIPRTASAAAIVLGASTAVVYFAIQVAPLFARQFASLVPKVKLAYQQLLAQAENLGIDTSSFTSWLNDPASQAATLAPIVQSRAASFAVAVGEGAAILTLTLILWFFLMRDAPLVELWVDRKLGGRHGALGRSLAASWRALGGFMRGTTVVALIDAVGIAVGLLILQVPLVLPLAVLVFLGAYIPVIGATATGLLAVAVAFAEGGFRLAVGALIVVLIVQQVESSLLQPLIMRKAVSLHPVIVLCALTAGATLAGIVGAFLAVPIAAMCVAVVREAGRASPGSLHGADR